LADQPLNLNGSLLLVATPLRNYSKLKNLFLSDCYHAFLMLNDTNPCAKINIKKQQWGETGGQQ
jgi:hypothetical protein